MTQEEVEKKRKAWREKKNLQTEKKKPCTRMIILGPITAIAKMIDVKFL